MPPRSARAGHGLVKAAVSTDESLNSSDPMALLPMLSAVIVFDPMFPPGPPVTVPGAILPLPSMVVKDMSVSDLLIADLAGRDAPVQQFQR